MIVVFRLVAALGALVLVAATMVFGAPATQAAAGASQAGAGTSAAHATVTITDQLSTQHLSVTPGTRVTWVNKDDETHRMVAEDGAVEFDSGNIDPGEKWSRTFNRPGDVTYYDDRDDENSAYLGMVMVQPAKPAAAKSSGTTKRAAATPGIFTDGDAVEVEIHNKNEFRPGTVTIAQGDTVEWYNDHSDIHTVTGAGGIDSGDLDRDERYSKTFNKPGTYDYVCVYHERMKATVRVADANGNVPPPPKNDGGDTPPPSNGGEQVAVGIGDNFGPANVTVPAGSVVTWTNNDSAPHTVTGSGFDSGMLTSAQTWSHTFKTPGTYDYVCAYHDNMTGSVRVTDASGDVPPPPPGDGGGGGGNPPPPGDGGGSPPPPDDGGGGGDNPPPGDGSQAPNRASVSVGDDFFRPGDVTIAEGGTVTWTQNGGSPHTVTGQGFDSGMMTGGQTFRHTFAEAGTYDYECEYHSDMTATVTVVGEDGTAPPPPPDDTPPPPDDNPPPPGDNNPPPPGGNDGGAGTKAPAKASVQAGDDFFSPKTVTVRTGGTVTWTNKGSNPHTVTGSGFDSGMLMSGKTFTKKFTKAGTYRYECAYHSGMTGTLKVVNDQGEAPPVKDNGPGGDGNGGRNGGGTGGTGGTGGGGGAAGGGKAAPGSQTHTVTMGSSSFSPKVLSARVGDTVVFKNASPVPHNAVPFTSSPIMGGQSYTTVLREQGTITYECEYHSGMTGTIKVAAAPAGTKLPPPSAGEGLSGGASGASAVTSSGSTGSSGPAAAPAPGAESHTISMVNSTFDPQTLQARVGDEVTWVNDDPIPHNVTGGPLDSGMMMGGAEFTTVLTEAGTIEYECTLHPGMTGTLEVAEALPGTEVPAASSSTTSGSSSAGTASEGQPSASAEPEEGAKNHTVEMVNFLYEPDPLEVNVGDTVTFVNKDAAPHTATASDKSWDSGNMNQGDEWTLKTDKVGTAEYLCIYHPNMTGTLIVKPADAEIAAAGAGSGGTSDTVSTMSASDIAGFSSGWLVLLAFLAGLQLQSRLAARRGSPTRS